MATDDDQCKCSWAVEPHETWGDCIRSKSIQFGDAAGRSRNQKFDASLDNYAAARRQGIQPKTTTAKDVKRAVEISDRTGVAYRDDSH